MHARDGLQILGAKVSSSYDMARQGIFRPKCHEIKDVVRQGDVGPMSSGALRRSWANKLWCPKKNLGHDSVELKAVANQENLSISFRLWLVKEGVKVPFHRALQATIPRTFRRTMARVLNFKEMVSCVLPGSQV